MALNKAIRKRLNRDYLPSTDYLPEEQKSLSSRLDMKRLQKAIDKPIYMHSYFICVNDFNSETRSNIKHTTRTPCNTIGCIAGNVLLNELSATERRTTYNPLNSFRQLNNIEAGLTTATIAAAILNLTDHEADQLFNCVFPERYKVGTVEYHQEVVKAVNRWLRDNGVQERVS